MDVEYLVENPRKARLVDSIGQGTVFEGKIVGYQERLFIKSGRSAVSLETGRSWDGAANVFDYRPVRAKVVVQGYLVE